MYAVIKTGGKQYRVAADDVLEVEKIAGAPGSRVEFGEVLMVGGNGEAQVGTPMLSGAKVTAEVLEQGRGAKVIAFKKRRRKNSRRKRGHRQELTTVRILEVLSSGQSATREPTGAGVVRPMTIMGGGRRFRTLKAPEGRSGDDLTRIDGIDARTRGKLNRAGVFHLWQIVAMNGQDIAAFDRQHGLDGRITRESWGDKARELLFHDLKRDLQPSDNAEQAD